MRHSKPFYTASDISTLKHLESHPGEAPFVRGPFAEMYRQKPWTIRQYTGFASATVTNKAFRKSLAEGGQGLSIAFDLATHLGFDSDHPAALADVGRTGVAIDSVEDMKRLLTGIDLEKVSVSMTMNGAVLPIMAAFIVAAEESGARPSQLRGTIQNDILKEFMVRNTYIFAPDTSMRISLDVVEYLNIELPEFNSMSISGYHFQEAGAEPDLELALTLANAFAYLDKITERGLNLDDFCPRLSFFFGIGMNFFEEIAKLRAARLLWSQEIERRGATSEKSRRMKMHCQTSGWSLTAKEPQNNLIRTTIEAMAAVFGGTQSLHTNAYDEALSLPTENSARLARNTQLIMQHEAGLCDVADPWGGSYMMESLTHEIAQKALTLLERINDEGGIIAALQSGWVQQQIQNSSVKTQSKLDSAKQTLVGENRFFSDLTDHTERLEINSDQVLYEQNNALKHLKQTRNQKRVNQALNKLSNGVNDKNVNLLALTIEAIRARATIGECTAALLNQQTRFQQKLHFAETTYHLNRKHDLTWRKAQKEVTVLTQLLERKPSILMVKLGLDGHDRGMKVVASGLNDAGFHVDLGHLFCTPAEVCEMLRSTHYDALGISLLSGAHNTLITQLMNKLRQEPHVKPTAIFLGGIIPDSDIPHLKELGITRVFQTGASIETIATGICRDLKEMTQFNEKPHLQAEEKQS